MPLFNLIARFLMIIFNVLIILYPNIINVFFYGLLMLHGELLVLQNLIFMDAKCYFKNPSASKLLLSLIDSIT